MVLLLTGPLPVALVPLVYSPCPAHEIIHWPTHSGTIDYVDVRFYIFRAKREGVDVGVSQIAGQAAVGIVDGMDRICSFAGGEPGGGGAPFGGLLSVS